MENQQEAETLKTEIAAKRRTSLFKTIDGFYTGSGISGPVENLGNLLTDFFTHTDQSETDNQGNPELTYKLYNPEYVYELVYQTTQTINFLIKLKEDWDCHPDNLTNHINQPE